ncbi:hypothetical protein Ahy_A07g032601 isoform A [Arachis hypogaea]|uniref:HAT C-terminal dimerisation domain-containing protein n=1 Tax=Arachis hypogaea TaxID=3818 RepID=A0A445C759_ARAHY|nr:hypothetical protein Ahy_A07g032601 isoform A [Arachis hypogaea]
MELGFQFFKKLQKTYLPFSCLLTSDHIIATHSGSFHENTVEALICNQNWLWAADHKKVKNLIIKL